MYLLQNGPDDLEWQGVEFVLLEEVVEVLFQHLKHQAGVAEVLETLQGPHHVVLVGILVTQTGQDPNLGGGGGEETETDEPAELIDYEASAAERKGSSAWSRKQYCV